MTSVTLNRSRVAAVLASGLAVALAIFFFIPDDSWVHVLWQTAVGLERGGLMNAAEELRRLQALLAQALAQGAPQEVIDSLLQRYREALQRYLQALAQNPQSAAAHYILCAI